jgi:hypothetical protein
MINFIERLTHLNIAAGQAYFEIGKEHINVLCNCFSGRR